ncbi:MAG: hypothetical protein ABI366_05365 [Ginsengibacter sp.]
MKRFLFIVSIMVALIFITGCRPSRVVVRERPVEPHYVQPLAPGPNYIWHNGEWIRHGNTYIFHKGFWIKAPSHRRYYTTGHWQRRRAGWVWISGQWR